MQFFEKWPELEARCRDKLKEIIKNGGIIQGQHSGGKVTINIPKMDVPKWVEGCYTPVQRSTSDMVYVNGVLTNMRAKKNYRSIEEPFESSRFE